MAIKKTGKPHQQSPARDLLEKIVINAGVGRASATPNFEDKVLKQIEADLSAIAGQKAQVRRSRMSIAGFKMREGQIVGLKTTLRRRKMVDFFNRLTTIVLPRVRDFTGLDPKIVDKGGVLNIGFREQFVFPEVNPEESPYTFSLGVNVVPKKKDQKAALEAYKALGVPFRAESAAPVKGKKAKKK
jgi:large subunit ribosomal protein L5